MYNMGAMMPWIDYTPPTLDEILEKYSSKSLDKSEKRVIIQTVKKYKTKLIEKEQTKQ